MLTVISCPFFGSFVSLGEICWLLTKTRNNILTESISVPINETKTHVSLWRSTTSVTAYDIPFPLFYEVSRVLVVLFYTVFLRSIMRVLLYTFKENQFCWKCLIKYSYVYRLICKWWALCNITRLRTKDALECRVLNQMSGFVQMAFSNAFSYTQNHPMLIQGWSGSMPMHPINNNNMYTNYRQHCYCCTMYEYRYLCHVKA